jgi:hypothetical protein
VASILVERAKVLASFAKPADAFTDRWSVPCPNQPNPAKVYELDARILEFTMVVARANNVAVENVTREFPNLTKIAERYRGECSYFERTASFLLNHQASDEEDGESDGKSEAFKGPRTEAWGLVSAVLGKKANRKFFVNALQGQGRCARHSGHRPAAQGRGQGHGLESCLAPFKGPPRRRTFSMSPLPERSAESM